MTPTQMTSMLNTAAVSGVPNKAANTALMPASTITRWLLRSSRIFSPSQPPMLPPICSAAPSRPALPPSRWVMKVAMMMSGVSRRGARLPCWALSSTALVPRSVPMRHA